jgi:Chitinase class I
MIDRKRFFDTIRKPLFGGRFTRPQVEGLSAILDRWERELPDGDPRWLAYMLATAHHETGRTMQPVRETFAESDAIAIARLDAAFARGQLRWVSKPYWLPDEQGRSWLGRGFVQLTHKRNYRAMGDAIGIDLLSDPDKAIQLDVALSILIEGMTRGMFTGRKLADYFDVEREDWRSARKIINGLESADTVATYGRLYHAATGAAQ